jgi:RNA polymerase sigma-70 factor (ECF subfamily)
MDAMATTRRIRREADAAERFEPRARFRRKPVAAQAPAADHLIAETVTRAREGDQDALKLLYLWYADGVYSYVCSILTDEHAAEDITQSVFARLPIRLQRYEPRGAPFGAWIVRVARNAAIDYLRSQRAVPQEEVRDPGAAQETSAGDRLEAIREALAVLPEDQREVLTLRFIVGLSPSEIGHRLGRSEQSINALQHRGRRRLREELTRRGAAPAVRAAG